MEQTELPGIGILVGTKGRGSNMAALASACHNGTLPARVGLVVAPSETSPALQVAASMHLPTAVVDFGAPDAADRLIHAFQQAGCELVCLAGFMRLLPPEFLAAFPDRVLNIHPALLPKFGGKGMYGHHVHQAVIQAGEEESGCTVHLVDENYDEGRILLQMRCDVEPSDTPETLAAKVLQLEHQAYALAVAKVLAGTRK